jgi:hypothetical protein
MTYSHSQSTKFSVIFVPLKATLCLYARILTVQKYYHKDCEIQKLDHNKVPEMT